MPQVTQRQYDGMQKAREALSRLLDGESEYFVELPKRKDHKGKTYDPSYRQSVWEDAANAIAMLDDRDPDGLEEEEVPVQTELPL